MQDYPLCCIIFQWNFFKFFLIYLTLNVCLCNIEFESELQCRFAFNFISGRNFMLKWFMLTVYITLCCYVMWSFCRWTKKIYLPKRRAFNIIVCGLILIFAASIFLGKFLPENDYQLLIYDSAIIGWLLNLI